MPWVINLRDASGAEADCRAPQPWATRQPPCGLRPDPRGIALGRPIQGGAKGGLRPSPVDPSQRALVALAT